MIKIDLKRPFNVKLILSLFSYHIKTYINPKKINLFWDRGTIERKK